MTAPTITWSRGNYYADASGVAWAEIAVPAGMTFQGGWAESTDQYGDASAHYSCTPLLPGSTHNYGTGQHQVVGTYIRWYDPDDHTSQMYINVGFACDPGQQIRAHLFTVS